MDAPAILPPSGVSFHLRLTIHGTGPNQAAGPRKSFAIHLRTESSRPATGSAHCYVSHLDDPLYCPVIYGAA